MDTIIEIMEATAAVLRILKNNYGNSFIINNVEFIANINACPMSILHELSIRNMINTNIIQTLLRYPKAFQCMMFHDRDIGGNAIPTILSLSSDVNVTQ